MSPKMLMSSEMFQTKEQIGLIPLCSTQDFFLYSVLGPNFLSPAGNLRKTIKMMKEFFSVTREMNELGVLREDLDIRNSK